MPQGKWKLVGGKFTKVPAGPPPPKPKAPQLPCGRFIKVVQEAFDADTFMLVTNGLFGGSVLGPRLDRGRGFYPDCRTTGMTLPEAQVAFRKWEYFMELQQQKKK